MMQLSRQVKTSAGNVSAKHIAKPVTTVRDCVSTVKSQATGYFQPEVF